MVTRLNDNREAWNIAGGIARELIEQGVRSLDYPRDVDIVSDVPNQLGYADFSREEYRSFITMVNQKVASYTANKEETKV